MKEFKYYMIYWLSQAVSQLGSAMTAFALTIWAFEQTGTAMTVSLMAFCSYLPYIAVSIFAGTFVDRHKKKKIIIGADTIAACCTAGVLIALSCHALSIWMIYIVNAIEGLMNAFQSPASSVLAGKMVPKDKYEKISGMNSFSSNLVTVASPMLAGALMMLTGLNGVLVIDIVSFLFAVIVMLFAVHFDETVEEKGARAAGVFTGFTEGYAFLKNHSGILYIMLSMALMNFFSRLTYENILSSMILARSNQNSTVFGIVSGVIGFGGILGGLMVTLGNKKRNYLKMIYFSAAFSFLFGDLLMGLGQNIVVWCIAGLAASIPIPYIMAAQSVILYDVVPESIQGRVFAVRNGIQFSTIPVGILLGGFLADHVFEPFMLSDASLARVLRLLVGSGKGSGMAVMFLCTGVLGSLFSILGYCSRQVRSVCKEIGVEEKN